MTDTPDQVSPLSFGPRSTLLSPPASFVKHPRSVSPLWVEVDGQPSYVLCCLTLIGWKRGQEGLKRGPHRSDTTSLPTRFYWPLPLVQPSLTEVWTHYRPIEAFFDTFRLAESSWLDSVSFPPETSVINDTNSPLAATA